MCDACGPEQDAKDANSELADSAESARKGGKAVRSCKASRSDVMKGIVVVMHYNED